MVHDRINQAFGNTERHYLSYGEATAALALADINILGMETIDGVELTNMAENEIVKGYDAGHNCYPDRYSGAALTPRVLVLYEYKWRYGVEPNQTKWNRAIYMWQGSCHSVPRDVDDPKDKTKIYFDESAIMLEIMERVSEARTALSEAMGVPRHGRL